MYRQLSDKPQQRPTTDLEATALKAYLDPVAVLSWDLAILRQIYIFQRAGGRGDTRSLCLTAASSFTRTRASLLRA